VVPVVLCSFNQVKLYKPLERKKKEAKTLKGLRFSKNSKQRIIGYLKHFDKRRSVIGPSSLERIKNALAKQ
jgi:hypothetical protein